MSASSYELPATRYLYGSIRASLAESAFATTSVPRIWRFRFDDLLVRMCCLKALLRTNLPPAVFLKRFAAPLCVFSFGISLFSARSG